MGKKIVLFGAGKIGRSAKRFCEGVGIDISFFCDNSNELWGSMIDGVEVISVSKLKCIKNSIEIYITCSSGESIYDQLRSEGFAEKQIHLYHWILDFYIDILKLEQLHGVGRDELLGTTDKIIFELSNGLALGGVETWVLQEVMKLNENGYNARVLYDVNGLNELEVEDAWKIQSNLGEYASAAEQIFHVYSILRTQLPCTVVCNFTSINLAAAVMAKHFFPNEICLIAVIHNDEYNYYESYGYAQRYISKCMVISEKIKKQMQNYGMPMKKLHVLNWNIPVDVNLKKNYSKQGQPLKLGYAGRITVLQKRLDLIVEVARRLKLQNTEIHLSIAGTGNYLEELLQRVHDEKLENCIYVLGQIDHDKISDFWKEQDIMISCSEWEGHSISQCEAMAQGVVPILTDVSGARDDVEDGKNGFIIPVGNLELMIEKILFLDSNRDTLEQMGKLAHKRMIDQHDKSNITNFENYR